MYRTARKTYPARKTVTGPRANKFAGNCSSCGENVPAGAGILGGYSGNWTVRHLPAKWHGSPVSGQYVNGCPDDTNRQNLAGQWGAYAEPHCADTTHAAQVTATGGCDSCNREVAAADWQLATARAAELAYGQYVADSRAPRQVDPDSAREASRRAGGKYAYTASGARMTLSSRRCEDAPCCGCCD